MLSHASVESGKNNELGSAMREGMMLITAL